MNPCRIRFIENALLNNVTSTPTPFKGLRFADIGCGGGILSESLARLGAHVVGIDPCENNVAIAREHAENDSRLRGRLEYRVGTAEDLVASGEEKKFDVVCALEVVEHVSDLELFVESCSALSKSGGDLFFSTVNRTPLSYALGIVAAEYVLRMVPPGTHDWNRFVTPNELEAALLRGNASVGSVCGMILNPISGRWFLNPTQHDVNYILHATRY
jgi:2-polyprenyl-6-hydroxyphenyl methylase / 3-demethylubiquinone-9 3-methyltransferase